MHGPQTDDFVRNRLTHSLEVAQVARDLSRALGPQPDIAETAALAHDLGHPPFGHNGEHALDELGEPCGGFEGNAQTLRLLTRLEAKTVDASGALGRAQPHPGDAGRLHQVPLAAESPELARVASSASTPTTCRSSPGCGAPATEPARRRCVEAQIMDLADDVAYSVHDVEDGVVAERVDLAEARPAGGVGRRARWYLPESTTTRSTRRCPGCTTVEQLAGRAVRRVRRSLAALKNLTSDLIGRFCGAVQEATFAAADGPFVRYRADLVVPEQTQSRWPCSRGSPPTTSCRPTTGSR